MGISMCDNQELVSAVLQSFSSGSLSNDDADVNENSKKAIVYFGKTTILHVHHAFLFISLSPLHDYDVKMPNFTFCGERDHKATTIFLFF